MNKTIDNIKSGNYEVVDNQGVSVTGHFTQCLEKEFADLEAKLAEKEKEIEKLNACVDFYKSYYISFNEKVINELEKVKEFVSRQLFITTKDCNDLDEAEAKGCNELREETIKEIDNQIKQLKEGVKNE